MAVTKTKSKTKAKSQTRRKTVAFTELESLTSRRRRSAYPTDARTERQYWLKQIAALMGEEF